MPGIHQIGPQVEQHPWDVDVHRAYFLAHATQGTGEGQQRGVLRPDQQRGDYGAYWPRIDPAVGVAAGHLIDGTAVETRATADAGQGLGIVAGVDGGAAVVDEDDVDVLRPIRLIGAARAVDKLGVNGCLLYTSRCV